MDGTQVFTDLQEALVLVFSQPLFWFCVLLLAGAVLEGIIVVILQLAANMTR